MSYSCTVKQEVIQSFGADDFSRHVYHIDSGNVLDDLLGPVSAHDTLLSNRCRTVSTSSVLSLPNISAYDLYPEIAGITSASESETEGCDGGDIFFATGDDYLRLEDVVTSPPPIPRNAQRRRRRSQVQHMAQLHGLTPFGVGGSPHEPTIGEMLDTLCYSTRDLTHINDAVHDIVLDWTHGAAISSDTQDESFVADTSTIVGKIKCEPTDADEQQTVPTSGMDVKVKMAVADNGVEAVEGIIASDVASLLEQFEEAEFKDEDCKSSLSAEEIGAKLDMDTLQNLDQIIARSVAPFVKPEPMNCETKIAVASVVLPEGKPSFQKMDITLSTQSRSGNVVILNTGLNVDLPGNGTKTEIIKRKRGRPAKNVKEVNSVKEKSSADAERVRMSEDLRTKMMERARAISQAISSKALGSKVSVVSEAGNNVVNAAASAPVLIRDGQHQLTMPTEPTVASDNQTASSGAGGSFRIPRLKKGASVLTTSFAKIDSSPVSKVAPPLIIEAGLLRNSEKVGWSKSKVPDTRKTGASRSLLRIPSQENVILMSGRVVVDASRNGPGVDFGAAAATRSSMLNISPAEYNPVRNPIVLDASWKMSPAFSDSSSNPSSIESNASSLSSSPVQDLSSTNSLSSAVSDMPSREIIDKIAAAAKRKSAILLPNAVPARGVRGTAVGIVTPSLQMNQAGDATSSEVQQNTIAAGSVEMGSASASEIPSTSSSSSSISGDGDPLAVPTKKRKLNISQYKSILPERRKALQVASLSVAAAPVPPSLPVVYVYGSSRIVALDHDYCQRPGEKPNENSEQVEEETEAINLECQNSDSAAAKPGNSDDRNTELSVGKLPDGGQGVADGPVTAVCDQDAGNERQVAGVAVVSSSAVLVSVDTDKVNVEVKVVEKPADGSAGSVVSRKSVVNLKAAPGTIGAEILQNVIRKNESERLAIGATNGEEAHGKNSTGKFQNIKRRNYRTNRESPGAKVLHEILIAAQDEASFVESGHGSVTCCDRPSSRVGPCSKFDTDVCFDVDNNVVSLSRQSRLDASRSVSRDTESSCESCSDRSRSSSRSSSWNSSHSSRSSRSRSSVRHRRHVRRRSYSSGSSSRSRSRSRSARSRTRSRSPLHSRRWARSRSKSFSRRRRSRSRSRSRWEMLREERRQRRLVLQRKQIEERRVVYVGKIPRTFTKYDLRRKFECFGEITDCSVHFRSHGDDYGFVTFVYTADAYRTIEKGRTIPGCDGFDFCFGGRRQFCKSNYADLDGELEEEEETSVPTYTQSACDMDFDSLLQQAKLKLTKK